jgi:hypothetical protein
MHAKKNIHMYHVSGIVPARGGRSIYSRIGTAVTRFQVHVIAPELGAVQPFDKESIYYCCRAHIYRDECELTIEGPTRVTRRRLHSEMYEHIVSTTIAGSGKLEVTRANDMFIASCARYCISYRHRLLKMTCKALPVMPCARIHVTSIKRRTCLICVCASNAHKPNHHACASLNAPRVCLIAALTWSSRRDHMQDTTSSRPSPCANSPPLPSFPLAAPKLMTSVRTLHPSLPP